MPKLIKRDILEARQGRYRRRMDLRVTTPEQAKGFVDDVDFCFLFPIQSVENLWMRNKSRTVELIDNTRTAKDGAQVQVD